MEDENLSAQMLYRTHSPFNRYTVFLSTLRVREPPLTRVITSAAFHRLESLAADL
jgi:hypothetical protein